jgi:cytochrome c-type biogenesis protein CcmH
MTIVFGSFLLVFCLVALLQLCWPFFYAKTHCSETSDPLLRDWYQSQQQELTQQFDTLQINSHLYQQNTLALQREWLQAQALEEKQKNTLILPKSLLVFIGIVFISLSLGFYWQQGSAKALLSYEHAREQSLKSAQFLAKMGGSSKIIAALLAQVQQHPQDAHGWYLLGRLYFSDNQFNAAIAAFTHANDLQPKNSDTELSLAEALYLNQPKNSQQATHLVTQLLQREPNNAGALNLMALLAYQAHDYQQAITLWQSLWVQMPANSDTAKALQKAINQARQDSQSNKKH